VALAFSLVAGTCDGKYLPITIREGVEGLDACVWRMAYGVSESTCTRTPVTVWKVAVPQRIDAVGVEWSVLRKDFLLVVDLLFRDCRRGDTAGEEQ